MLQLTFLPLLDISMLENFSPWLVLYTSFGAPFHDSLLSRGERLLLLTPAMPFPDKCHSQTNAIPLRLSMPHAAGSIL